MKIWRKVGVIASPAYVVLNLDRLLKSVWKSGGSFSDWEDTEFEYTPPNDSSSNLFPAASTKRSKVECDLLFGLIGASIWEDEEVNTVEVGILNSFNVHRQLCQHLFQESNFE